MKNIKVRRTCFILGFILSALLIAGCGKTGNWTPPDTTAPTATAVFPLNNAENVATNTKIITVAFSETMNPATLTTASVKLSCPAGTPVIGTVAYLAAENVATLTLQSVAPDLPNNAECAATVTTNAKDLAGNPLASDYVWTFNTSETADSIAPKVMGVVLVNEAAGMCVNDTIIATFSEAMNPDTINATTFFLTQGETVVSGDVAYSGVTAVFTLDNNLAPDTPYTVTITTGAKDLAGNALAGD